MIPHNRVAQNGKGFIVGATDKLWLRMWRALERRMGLAQGEPALPDWVYLQ